MSARSLLAAVPAGPMATLPLPKEFARLHDLAYNLWWSWDPLAFELWGRIDPRAWAATRNPVAMLQVVEPSTWDALSRSASFVQLYDDVVRRFTTYLKGDETWFEQHHHGDLAGPVAYFCAEFGIHDKLPFYSGGLGVLAGDHLKAASDLGVPLFGVGILYRRGYFRQAVDPDGLQQHTYIPVELSRRPVRQVLDASTGRPLRTQVALRGREVNVGAWRIDVGRVPLLLLDTDVPENDPADRPITHILYVRGREMRLCQEAVLGVGGARIVRALGFEPATWHVNEGHSALSLLERASWRLEEGADLPTAAASVKRRTLFTLHTPVPAGNEVFDLGVARSYLDGTIPGIGPAELEEYSRANEHDEGRFDLGALAIRLAATTNGVSQRHGSVVSESWGPLIGGPALGITNGIHPQTWMGRNINGLVSRAIGADWQNRLVDPALAAGIRSLPDRDVWTAHQAQKELMLRRLRARLRDQHARHGSSPERLRWVDDQLPPDRLTVVFARRFATYKRAGMIFSDPGRIGALLRDPDRPIQIVFAGKAHPADRDGQGLVRWVVEMSHSTGLESHVFFAEDYNMQLGTTLVTGADVWLNTPRPPKEASGTSGMKAAANGGLNLSVLDGWWLEGYNGNNGWGFGEHSSSDAEDAGYLYHLLETEVVPRYYDQDEDGVPAEWVAMMKEAMVTALTEFTTQRMLIDYTEQAYLPLGTSSEHEA